MNTPTPRIGFIGAGQMAHALAQGFLASGHVKGNQLAAFDVSQTATDSFSQLGEGVKTAASNVAVVEQSDTVFLAVKPQYIDTVLDEIGVAADESKLVISIAAGVPISHLESRLGGARVIRVMPNTPCLIGAGASVFACGSLATGDDVALAGKLLESVGVAFEAAEPQLDAVTGLSGSGPAYVYLAIEALSDGGVRAGLPRDAATRLAAQTVFGAAKMVLETGEHPAALKDKVASPGGTTIAGIAALEAAGFRHALIDAVQEATERSRELGQ